MSSTSQRRPRGRESLAPEVDDPTQGLQTVEESCPIQPVEVSALITHVHDLLTTIRVPCFLLCKNGLLTSYHLELGCNQSGLRPAWVGLQ